MKNVWIEDEITLSEMKKRLSIKITTLLSPLVMVFVFLPGVLFPPTADAHPHVFIVQRLEVVFDDKGLAGVRVRWKFDDMFAAMIAEDYDSDKNGSLEPPEVENVKKEAFTYIAEYNYFISIKIENKPFLVKYTADFNAVLKDKQLEYHFFVPCHVTATRSIKKVTVATYDPTYYTAIFFAKNGPVSLASAEPYEIKTAIREDPSTKIYFDMVHPWTLFLEFQRKS
ncbi:MAG: DUF1007 family protein [Desulfobacterales bacterium]|nr:DUF1007 family protein [Desulfobacterales bacterium]